ncbi:MAG: hypothetical protein FWB86_01175 [Treponema sp.]|nr:hypothetical protein [Treponema sp.]MCL2250710.1 hypothetical protein [Treponema sp.]
MEQDFIEILKTIIKEQGKEAIFDSAKCKPLLADYTKGEFKKESRILLQALDAKVQKAVNTSQEIDICRKQQIRLLHEDYAMIEETAADIVDTLIHVLKGVPFPKRETAASAVKELSSFLPPSAPEVKTPPEKHMPPKPNIEEQSKVEKKTVTPLMDTGKLFSNVSTPELYLKFSFLERMFNHERIPDSLYKEILEYKKMFEADMIPIDVYEEFLVQCIRSYS